MMFSDKICKESTCINGGTCTELTDDFHCHCMAAYAGKTCSFGKSYKYQEKSRINCRGRFHKET